MHQENYMPSQIRCSHILVKTENEAKELLEEIHHGASFEKIAETHSMCPSKKRGGGLGAFGRGQMAREFEKAAFALEKGQLSQPVKTEFGWHVIKRTG